MNQLIVLFSIGFPDVSVEAGLVAVSQTGDERNVGRASVGALERELSAWAQTVKE